MEIFPWDKIEETKKEETPNPAIINSFKNAITEDPIEDNSVDYGDIPENKEPGIPGQFYLSQSLIKQLTDRFGVEKEFCPHKIYHLYILKDIKSKKSEAMADGLYGESLILGAVAKNETKSSTLRANKNTGAPRVSQQRIIMQAERFKHLAAIYQINVIPDTNVQVPIFKKFGNNVILRGEIDIFPTSIIWEDELCLAMVDIKFTADVNSTFGPYAWGNVENVDYLQADFYHYLVRDFDLDLNIKHGHNFNQKVGYKNLFTDFVKKAISQNQIKFIYMIFGYKKPDLSNQFLMINRSFTENNSNLREKELVQRIRSSIAILAHSYNTGWQKIAYRDICKDCPLNINLGGDCKEPNKFRNV